MITRLRIQTTKNLSFLYLNMKHFVFSKTWKKFIINHTKLHLWLQNCLFILLYSAHFRNRAWIYFYFRRKMQEEYSPVYCKQIFSALQASYTVQKGSFHYFALYVLCHSLCFIAIVLQRRSLLNFKNVATRKRRLLSVWAVVFLAARMYIILKFRLFLLFWF